MFFYTFKYFSSNNLYMNFQVSSKSLCSDNSSKLQDFKASPRWHKKKTESCSYSPFCADVSPYFCLSIQSEISKNEAKF